MTLQTAVTPVHQQVFEALRNQVLFGDLAPGAAVTIMGLAEDLDAGMTPVREALRRMVAAGALTLQGNRRVVVPVLTLSDIDEISHLRHAVEPELTRRATLKMTGEILSKLREIDLLLDAALSAGDVAGYLQWNHAFHHTLYEVADAPILGDVAEGLWLRFGPSMRVICGRLGTAQLPDQHKALLSALAKGDSIAAARAMEDDVAQGMDQLRVGL